MTLVDRKPSPLNRSDLLNGCLLTLVVAAIFGARLGVLPLHGEESRWAGGAALMMETGDWIVPRQQYRVFPERPPLSSWAMAGASKVCGGLNGVAVRLPSVIGIVLTMLLIFFYSRQFLEPIGALTAAGAYASMAQVLQIGRVGESESLFTLFVASSLLLWHWAYASKWPNLALWMIPYSAVALGALTKGIQAPIYFVSTIVLYLLIRRDWRTLFTWQHFAGLLLGTAIVAAWQIPFLQRTEPADTLAIWFGLVADRVGTGGMLNHLMSYPLETLACLLPWSLVLPMLFYSAVRQSVANSRDLLFFILISIAATYPSVWFSIGAKGRYFMPLYPCVAILVGLIAQAAIRSDKESLAYRVWGRFLVFMGTVAALVGLAVASANFFPQLEAIALGVEATVLVSCFSALCAAFIFWAKPHPTRSIFAIYSIVVLMGLIYDGVAIPSREKTRADFASMLAEVRNQLPADAKLASMGAVDHRFCFYYGKTIPQLDWPAASSDVPDEIEYFCFDRRETDTAQRRTEGRGRVWTTTAGTLPFSWEEIARVPSDSRVGSKPRNHIVIGRRIREPRSSVAKESDAGPAQISITR